MRSIPLNFQTMYADLLQTVALAEVAHGSISLRKIKGQEYLYLTTKRRLQTSPNLAWPCRRCERSGESQRGLGVR